jgi:hypothetical protein
VGSCWLTDLRFCLCDESGVGAVVRFQRIFRGFFVLFEPSVKGLLVPVPVAAEIFLISTARRYWFGVVEHKQNLH